MRKNPTNQATILDLLEKGKRNLHGIELRTLSKDEQIDLVEFSSQDLKKVNSLIQQIYSSLSLIEDRLIPQHQREVVRKKREPRVYSAVEKYMRKQR